MTDLLRILLSLSDEAYVFSTAYVILLIAFVGSRKEVRKWGRRAAVAAVVLFAMGGILATCLVVSSATRARYRLEIVDAVAACDLDNASVTLNGKGMRGPREFMRDVMLMGPPQEFKSDTTERIDVNVTDGGREISFVLGQDSRFADAFWVFKSGRHFPDRAWRIGTLKSPALHRWLTENLAKEAELPAVPEVTDP